VFGIFPANSVGDDIEVYDQSNEVLQKFCNLRNQVKKDKGVNLCLSDFVAAKETGKMDYLGAFACTAGIGIDHYLDEFEKDQDDYSKIMIKALTDRLAEALTELIHVRIRKEFWGFAPDEQLSEKDLFLERYQGIRPAHGYPACPDHSEKQTLWNLLKVEENTGIKLTESYSMYPAASVSGLIFAHPESRYFFVGKISKDQIEDYARRKGISISDAERLLSTDLNYK
jgi:5-methyltetrahydrofolate--homocysteine methyltransferase